MISSASNVLLTLGQRRLHPVAARYMADLRAAGGQPTLDGIRRMSRALRVLEQAGILGDLVFGVSLGSDLQLTTGAPLSWGGVAATLSTGTFSRTLAGFTATQSDSQGLAWVTPDTRTGTMVVDQTPGGTLGSASGGTVVMQQGATGTFWHTGTQIGYDGTNKPRLNTFASGSVQTQTSIVGQDAVARAAPRNSRQASTLAYTYGTTSVKHWVNGIESNPSPNATAPARATAQTRFSLFARMASGAAFSSVDRFQGTVRTAMLFGRELSTEEVRAATVAALILNPAPVVLMIEGDSLAEQIDFLVRTDDHWGRRLEVNHARWSADRVWQHNVATSGMSAESYDFAPYSAYQNQLAWMNPFILQKRVLFSIQGGTNDIGVNASGGPRTVAQIYGYLLDLARKVKAAGAETMIHTVPIPQSPTWNSTQQAKLAALNAHILTNAAADGFDYVVDAAAAVDMTISGNRVDDVHPNGTGNTAWALAVATVLSSP